MMVVEKPSGGLSNQKEIFSTSTFEEIASRLSGAKLFMKLDANKGYWQIPLDKESIRLILRLPN